MARVAGGLGGESGSTSGFATSTGRVDLAMGGGVSLGIDLEADESFWVAGGIRDLGAMAGTDLDAMAVVPLGGHAYRLFFGEANCMSLGFKCLTKAGQTLALYSQCQQRRLGCMVSL